VPPHHLPPSTGKFRRLGGDASDGGDHHVSLRLG
jgi:hypothetical protein